MTLNALLAASDKKLRFLDFEYAGWDDPAKLIGDFFCQPAIPAPHSEFERFVVLRQEAGVSTEQFGRSNRRSHDRGR